MRGKLLSFGLILGLVAGVAAAQTPKRTTVDEAAMYCAGAVTTDAIPHDSYIISGEQSIDRVAFVKNTLVYINRGSAQGVKMGDEFQVVREVKDTLREDWFHGQSELKRAMGPTWADLGMVKVVHVGDTVSTAQVMSSCDYIQRGDIILPFTARPALALKPDRAILDPFAPANGKAGMIVSTKNLGQSAGVNSVVYVNVGSAQGAKIGGYMRVFRNQGRGAATIYQDKNTEYQLLGFGSTPLKYTWDFLPREILGEGIVVRVSGNTATLLITSIRREIYAGDYVEIEQ